MRDDRQALLTDLHAIILKEIQMISEVDPHWTVPEIDFNFMKQGGKFFVM